MENDEMITLKYKVGQRVRLGLTGPNDWNGYAGLTATIAQRDSSCPRGLVYQLRFGRHFAWSREDQLTPITKETADAEILRKAAEIVHRRNPWGPISASDLEEFADHIEREASKPAFDPSPFQSPGCPDGYQTVIGWLAQQGIEAEDLGARAGLWAWKQKHPQAIKVRACPAILETGVTDWLMAYPLTWLEANREEIVKRAPGRV